MYDHRCKIDAHAVFFKTQPRLLLVEYSENETKRLVAFFQAFPFYFNFSVELTLNFNLPQIIKITNANLTEIRSTVIDLISFKPGKVTLE